MREGKRSLRGVRKSERSCVRTKRVIRNDRLRHEIRTRRLHPRVDVRAEVAVRPPVESAVAHRGHVVRHEIAAELVTLVHCCPERSGSRLPGEPYGISQARCEDAMAAGARVDLPDRRTLDLLIETILRDVAVRPDPYIQFRPIWTGDETLG